MSSDSFAKKLLRGTVLQYQDYEYPKISITIPSYNCSQTIPITLESLLSQQYPEFEIIVVDSDSNDHTREVIQRYRSDRLILHVEPGANRYELMNKGIEYSSGEYIKFLFPGDFYVCKDTLNK